MKPPIIPTKSSNAMDAVNFKKLKESVSFDLDRGNDLPTPPATDDDEPDPFAAFKSGKPFTYLEAREQEVNNNRVL